MPDDWAAQFTGEALARVDAFIAQHPGYTRRGVAQPDQGATNRVVFARRDDELVVYKVLCQRERKDRECFAFRHWQGTGLVPELLVDVDEFWQESLDFCEIHLEEKPCSRQTRNGS